MSSPACSTGVAPADQSGSIWTVPDGYASDLAWQYRTGESKCDWYRTTVPAHPDLAFTLLRDRCFLPVGIEEGRGQLNYHHRRSAVWDGERVFSMNYGGPNGHPSIEASGAHAQWLAWALWDIGGDHLPSRIDICVDLWGDGLFMDARKELRSIARDTATSGARLGGPRSLKYGEELYPLDDSQPGIIRIGSRTSEVYGRFYEKGKQLFLESGMEGQCPSLLKHLNRFEIEVKMPKRAQRAELRHFAPDQFWGLKGWTRCAAERLLKMAPEPISLNERRLTSDEKSLRVMCTQYGGRLKSRLDYHQGDELALIRELLAWAGISQINKGEDA